MINTSCSNWDGDEDCNKCTKHGYIFGCEGCEENEEERKWTNEDKNHTGTEGLC